MAVAVEEKNDSVLDTAIEKLERLSALDTVLDEHKPAQEKPERGTELSEYDPERDSELSEYVPEPS